MDAALTVRLPAGRSTYAVGEIIPLELEFRGRAGSDYFFSTASGDRLGGGRERYEVTPAGGSDDPMAELLSSVGIAGSVLSGWHPLDGTPFVVRVRLNEWVRFTKPGEYRLVVESTRLERYSHEPAPKLTSSPLTLRIETPTPEWAAAEVSRAVAALEGRGPGTAREGTAILRHLGTRDPAAAREAFLALPRRTQALLLGYRWSGIAGPWIQPALETVYDKWRGDARFPGVGDAALRRLAEMDPARGRALAIDEIRTGARGLAPETLTSLLGESVPDLDEALRQRYRAARSEEGEAATMELIARYGSARLLPLVRVEIDRDPSCPLEAAALAYLLEHDPPPALRRLQPAFDRRRSGTCVVPPWSEIASLHWDQAVEAAAIAHLQRGRELCLTRACRDNVDARARSRRGR